MRDDAKTKKQLVAELHELRGFIGEYLNDRRETLDLYDLNQLKEASRKMKRSREKFAKSFLKNALPMGFATQKEGCLVEVNEAFLKMSGYKRSEVIGNTVAGLGLLTDEQRNVIMDKVDGKGRIENIEIRLRTKNRKQVDGLLNMVRITVDGDKYRLIVLTDISKLKRNEVSKKINGPVAAHLPINAPMPWFIN